MAAVVTRAIGIYCVRLMFVYGTNFTNFTIWCKVCYAASYETSHDYSSR